MDDYTIENKYGSLIIDSGQKPRLGLQAFAEYFRLFSECVFMPNEKLFYIYNRKNGLWEPQSKEAMISKISEEILDLARAEEIKDEFVNMRRPAVIKDILVYLSTLAQVPESFFDKNGNWIHCLNGVVEVDEYGRCELKPFSPDYHSRNRCNLVYCFSSCSASLSTVLRHSSIKRVSVSASTGIHSILSVGFSLLPRK